MNIRQCGTTLAAVWATLPAAIAEPGTVTLQTGPWRAWLESPGGELPFGLELQSSGAKRKAWIINGEERLEVPRMEIAGDEVVLSITHYDSTLRGKLSEDGKRLDGEWKKRSRGERWVVMPFHATAGGETRFGDCFHFDPSNPAREWSGRWSVKFKDDSDPAVLMLRVETHGLAVATILTPTGDYRYLAGDAWASRVRDRQTPGALRLSTFDGAHAFLFKASMAADGQALTGDFWSGDKHHDTWTATRDSAAVLPDAFEQTRGVDGVRLESLAFPDLNGIKRSLGDPMFAGKALILEVFGSWCPNCNDASAYLVELHREYKDRGLSIVGLAFEYSGDFQRDVGQVRIFAEHHKIEYPLLLAGDADKEKASAALPLIDKLRAFPTLIVLDSTGRVRTVYTGFSGPATGEEHTKFRARFQGLIEGILAESGFTQK